MLMESSAGQLLASVISTVKVPGAKPDTVGVLWPLDQAYTTGIAAPLTVTDAVPLLAPLQLTLVADIPAVSVQLKLLTVTVCTDEQAFASCTVTV